MLAPTSFLALEQWMWRGWDQGASHQLLLFNTPGEDGPSQMALEDLAMFRSIPMSTVFYPSDGVATEKAVELAANTKVSHVVVLFEASSSIERQKKRPAQRQSWSLVAQPGRTKHTILSASWQAVLVDVMSALLEWT